MASPGLRSSFLTSFATFFALLSSGVFITGAFGQEPRREAADSQKSWATSGDRPYQRADLTTNWNRRGRTVPPGESAAALRLRAYRQKMAMRAWRASNPAEHGAGEASRSQSSSTPWTSVGPAPLASDATGDGMQNYNWVTGRAT